MIPQREGLAEDAIKRGWPSTSDAIIILCITYYTDTFMLLPTFIGVLLTGGVPLILLWPSDIKKLQLWRDNLEDHLQIFDLQPNELLLNIGLRSFLPNISIIYVVRWFQIIQIYKWFKPNNIKQVLYY